nr:type I restriction-modification system methyltransferase subunit [uncultured bacterium]
MNYPSIRIEGAILSPDILARIEDLPGQKPADFGLDSSVKVKDEIVRAWADAQDYWRIFQRKLETLRPELPATSETRQQWVVPLLALLGYQIEYQARAVELNGKLYNISHRAANRAEAPVQVVGYREPAGLDRKPENATLRMSAHAIVQEFINLNEQLYGLVTNGRVIRLLRDSSRLIKLSYLEFDLDRIFTDGLFSDFAVLYRLLHATRLPLINESATESWIEHYHLDSLESGARIREGLSKAVESAIRDFANGFLKHPTNVALRESVVSGSLAAADYYKDLLRLIYRLLFLMVIEERDLVFPLEVEQKRREIYSKFYSILRLRLLSEHRYLADHRRHDLWLSLQSTFRLFEADGPGQKLGVAPLAGDLFHGNAILHIAGCTLGNDVLLGCFRALNVYEHPVNHQLIRVNYAALNVEEFGSVYEGLLEFEPVFLNHGNAIEFNFAKGDERARTGSHYTPDDLVQPLIKHSLDYLIAERLKAPNVEAALLDLRVADIACGSGHILLAAARRIANELAVVRTGEEQPSPTAYRAAVRDVIRTCIYGVDLNPLAVELCKVALWLEAHNPGQPLNFLDHHIRCGNAIVGFVRKEELDIGVPDEAFATMPGDDKEIVALWRKTNKQDRKDTRQMRLAPAVQQRLEGRLARWNELSALPERTPAEIETKKQRFRAFTESSDAFLLSQMAAIPIAQFYLPKTLENNSRMITDSEFRRYWVDGLTPQSEGTATALAKSIEKRFFHWFLEFPDVIARGGFDCILGNPPYLGGTYLSGTYGYPFCYYVKWQYAPAGLSDLVVYFVRRIYELLKVGGFAAFITTNSIKDGDIREDGLEELLARDGQINMAVRGIKWPGRANLVVSLVAVHRGIWRGKRFLDGSEVPTISAFFEPYTDAGAPIVLRANEGAMYEGYKPLGDGFFISDAERDALIREDPTNADVLRPFINGQEISNLPDQLPSKTIIYFRGWSMERAQAYTAPFRLIEERMRSARASQNRPSNRDRWWVYGESRPALSARLETLQRCFIIGRYSKYLAFSEASSGVILSESLKVLTTDRWDLYAVVQSSLHEVWARKYSGAMKQDLRYSPSKCFDTFAFPEGLSHSANSTLAAIGERYHKHRQFLMLSLWLGITDIYNLFHARDLSPALVSKASKKTDEEAARGYEGLLELRRLHCELDQAIRDAYGWQSLPLDNGFYELESLAENDRVRYTISLAARKEVLRRLLKLNHERAEAEKTAAKPEKTKRGKKFLSPDHEPIEMFAEES